MDNCRSIISIGIIFYLSLFPILPSKLVQIDILTLYLAIQIIPEVNVPNKNIHLLLMQQVCGVSVGKFIINYISQLNKTHSTCFVAHQCYSLINNTLIIKCLNDQYSIFVVDVNMFCYFLDVYISIRYKLLILK